ncbi:MAG: DUF3987 domain-containing protein [Clostridiales bacterium]|nr:DUF3987 domain-containing protein [Clostridiales bacterium]
MNYQEERAEYDLLAETDAGREVLGEGWKSLPEAPIAPMLDPSLLPPVLRNMAEAVAANQSAPFDLPAIIGLGVASACAAGRVRVALRTGWSEAAQLYQLCIMESGEGKTPAFKAMTGLLMDEQAKENKYRVPQTCKDETALRILEKKKHKAVEKGNLIEAQSLDDEILSYPKTYLMRRFIGGNVTPERLPDIMNENNGATSILDDEGELFELLAGRYQDRPNLDPWLKGYSGDTPLTSERKSGSTIVDNPNLSVLILAQPCILKGLFEDERMTGKGLLGRFLMSAPIPLQEYQEELDIPSAVLEDYNSRVLQLMDVPSATLTMTTEASAAFFEWRKEVKHRKYGEYSPLCKWGYIGKLAGNTARLAGLVKLWDNPDVSTPITINHLRSAIGLAEYFAGNLLAMMQQESPISRNGKSVLELILQQKEKPIKESIIKQKLKDRKRAFPDGNAMEVALSELEKKGYIYRRKTTGNGRPSVQIDIHPQLDGGDVMVL